MSEPQNPETNPVDERLTTEQLANAGERNAATAEPRAFDEGRTAGRDERESETGGMSPLLPPGEAEDLRRTWESIQGGFVDEPRQAVEEADQLVAKTMKRLAEVFAEERGGLESQWDRGGDVSTEELRVALQRYRAFFGRLLAI